MTENEKARELIATSETTVKVDPQNGWYLKRFAALQFEGSVDNFSTNIRAMTQKGRRCQTMLNEIFAREILETSIALGFLQEMNGGVVIYHEASKEDPENLPAGWYIDDKDYTTFSIANDPEAVKYLKAPLKNGGYSFEERKAFWDSFFDFKAPKLRLPVKIAKRSGCKL